MAEATGLALGAVALVSLFGTCLDLFDRVQAGRYLVGGHLSACDKVDLLRIRLERWAEPIRICETSLTNSPAFGNTPLDVCHVVARNLVNVKNILSEATTLKEKYQLVVRGKESVIKGVWFPRRASVGFQKRTLWAIHDKQKFNNLIQELSFLIDNLDKVAVSVMSLSPAALKKSENHATKRADPSSVKRKPVAEKVSDEIGSNDSHSQPEARKETRKDENLPKRAPAYHGTQTNDDSLGVAGDIVIAGNGAPEPEHTRRLYTVNQTNTKKAIGVMGNFYTDKLTGYTDTHE